MVSITSDTPGQHGRAMPAVSARSAPREALADRIRRLALGLAWATKPPRTRDVPAVLYLLARHHAGLGPDPAVPPDPEQALGDGIAGICPDLAVNTLVQG